ncbi:MAG: hypothetical protein V7L30_33420 [Nostoc sp.]|uniref:hypothetical protein n=1 Tax=Nostoc sp. TaxID=1180 RepID=UPI002FF67F0A
MRLKVIAHSFVSDACGGKLRPGRSESRVRKRRPKIYPLMTKLRHEFRNMKANSLIYKCFSFLSVPFICRRLSYRFHDAFNVAMSCSITLFKYFSVVIQFLLRSNRSHSWNGI